METIMKECCDPEDEDGCLPYEGKCMHSVLVILYTLLIVHILHLSGSQCSNQPRIIKKSQSAYALCAYSPSPPLNVGDVLEAGRASLGNRKCMGTLGGHRVSFI